MKLLSKTLKGVALFVATLSIVTIAAAIVGCLFLPNGHVAYLIQPQALFEFVWVTRAGLKVTIFFVTMVIFLMLADNGALSRRWL